MSADEIAALVAEAEQRGREDNADHSMCYVSGSKALAAREAEARRDALTEAADAWLHGAWGDTPRNSDRVADRIGAAQFFGDWLRDRAKDA